MGYDEDFYEVIKQGCLSSAEVVVPEIMRVVEPRRVVDVGCGEGWWLSVFEQCGCEVAGIDGNYVNRNRLAIQPIDFFPRDLSGPFEWTKGRYDLAISLEVAEHLPEASADEFVANLVALSDVVLFSAAVPGQGGTGHLNEQWPDYWVKKFATYNHVGSDVFRWRFWDDSRVENWYRQNMLLFVDKEKLDSGGFPPGISAVFETNNLIRSVVHPALWDSRR